MLNPFNDFLEREWKNLEKMRIDSKYDLSPFILTSNFIELYNLLRDEIKRILDKKWRHLSYKQRNTVLDKDPLRYKYNRYLSRPPFMKERKEWFVPCFNSQIMHSQDNAFHYSLVPCRGTPFAYCVSLDMQTKKISISIHALGQCPFSEYHTM